MEYRYGECQKTHAHKDGKVDGCQEFKERWNIPDDCRICGCHQSFHRREVAPVKYITKIVYTKCHKMHDFKFQTAVDGCQEFVPAGTALRCLACGCHKSFHRNEITEVVEEQITNTITSPTHSDF